VIGTEPTAELPRDEVAQPQDARGRPHDTDDPPQDGFVAGVVGRVDRRQRQHRITAFPFAVVKKFGDDQAGNLAALVSYYLFFSIFPLLLVFTTVLGLVFEGRPDVQRGLLDSALANFPVVGDQIRSDIGTAQGSGLVLVAGLVVALWGGMGAVAAMQDAMNAIWDVPRRDRPALVSQRLRSLAVLALLAVAVALSTLVGGAAGGLSSWPAIGRITALVPGLAVNVGLFLVAFKLLPSRPTTWSMLWPGAVVAGVFFTTLQTVGGAYVDHVVQRAGPVYGSFAVVLGLLSFLYLQAQLTMLAAEINVVRFLHLWPRGIVADDPTRADTAALERSADTELRHPDQIIDVRFTSDRDGGPDPADDADRAEDRGPVAAGPHADANRLARSDDATRSPGG
jgi:inner membrane protein YhjD